MNMGASSGQRSKIESKNAKRQALGIIDILVMASEGLARTLYWKRDHSKRHANYEQ